jgi:hypothetical protein
MKYDEFFERSFGKRPCTKEEEAKIKEFGPGECSARKLLHKTEIWDAQYITALTGVMINKILLLERMIKQ